MHGETEGTCGGGDSESLKTVDVGSSSDVGRVREDNQDYFGMFPEDDIDLSSPKGQLFIVADGMGGHKAGREASELAVNLVAYYYHSVPEDDIPQSLTRALEGANRHIHSYSENDPRLAGMGTTCVALALQGNRAYIGHIGDSRVYRINRLKVTQLTHDHSKVAEMVRRRILTKEEARTHPQRSHLYRALGTRSEAEFDIIENITLKTDDYFLMCTDGLYNHVSDREMKSIVLANVPVFACRELVALANERGGTDNITVQVIHAYGG